MSGATRGGHDRLSGGVGDDFLVGDALQVNDTVVCGRDRLVGGAGNDLLVGDAASANGAIRCGDDVLDGGPGDDQLHGDVIDPGSDPALVRGRDVFRFGPDSGLDTVHDLELGKDVLDFRSFGGDPERVRFLDLGASVLVDLDGTNAAIQEVVLLGMGLDSVLRELDRTILF
jgi:Ca2+-binding RTX toxin-like protein